MEQKVQTMKLSKNIITLAADETYEEEKILNRFQDTVYQHLIKWHINTRRMDQSQNFLLLHTL